MKLIVKDCQPWDGEYECDIFEFTNRELHKLKVVSEGIRPGELVEALDSNDTAAFVGVSVVVLEQHGLTVDPEDFWSAKVGSLTLVVGEKPVPPTMPAIGGEPSENTNGSTGVSSLVGEQVGNDQSPTGSHSSETLSTVPDLDPATLAT